MFQNLLKYLIISIFIPLGNGWSYNPFCWTGKCDTRKLVQKRSYLEFLHYSLVCLIWECENENNEYSWNTLNPYCWITDCHRIDEKEHNFFDFRLDCIYSDCNNKKDKQTYWFSFISYIPWAKEKNEGSKQTTDNSKSWRPSALNPLCWFGRCSNNGVEESHRFGMSEFVNAAKRYLNPQTVIDRLNSIHFTPSDWLGERCNEHYIPGDVKKLSALLKNQLYGQHLVNDNLIAALTSHWSKEPKSKKALALSFHGWTGSGKNYAASMISKSLFKVGTKSRYVHHFSARVLFTLDSEIDEYRENLYQWLKSNVTTCPRQLFIFDEVEMMPEGILNAITPMIDYNDVVDGADYTKAIFLFLSNTGADLILKRYEELIEIENKTREQIELRDFKNLINNGAFNAKGGFHHSDTISNNLIDHYIPFLPMEKKHVLKCIKDEYSVQNVTSPSKEHLENVLESVRWGLGESKQFSKTGCKMISSKVGIIIEKYYKKNQKQEL